MTEKTESRFEDENIERILAESGVSFTDKHYGTHYGGIVASTENYALAEIVGVSDCIGGDNSDVTLYLVNPKERCAVKVASADVTCAVLDTGAKQPGIEVLTMEEYAQHNGPEVYISLRVTSNPDRKNAFEDKILIGRYFTRTKTVIDELGQKEMVLNDYSMLRLNKAR